MWFWLSLGAALFGAVTIILNKKALNQVSAAVLTWALLTFTIPPLFILSVIQGFPSFDQVFLLAMLGSAITYVFGKTILNEALKQNLISQILPLTAFSGVFTYIFGLLLLSETLKPIPVAGLLLVVVGSYFLNVNEAKEDILKPFKLLFATKTSVLFMVSLALISLTAIFDKTGVITTKPNDPIFTMLIEQILMAIFLTFYLIKKEGKTWINEIRVSFWFLILNSLVFLVESYFGFAAYIDGPVALVIGVKRLQIFFILLMGYIFFKDKPSKQIWLATAIMIFGVLLIKLG